MRLEFDELGIVVYHFAGAQRLAASPFIGGTGRTVYKSLSDFPVRHEDVAMLKENGWSKKTLKGDFGVLPIEVPHR